MAIYHLRATMISRSQGRSATAAAAYRAGVEIHDLRTGETFDYSRKGGVLHTGIIAPDTAPDWVQDRAALWNEVEATERRINSQVAREIRVALPSELALEANVALVERFAQRQFVARGMVADIAIHAPGQEGDERNTHAHILLTTRNIDETGFTTKDRSWNAVDLLETWRKAWALETNAALEAYEIDDRIDHRTLEAQREEQLELSRKAEDLGDLEAAVDHAARAMALDREPLPQLSRGAWQAKAKGLESFTVDLWYAVKDQAQEVARIAMDFRDQAMDWIAEKLEKLKPTPEADWDAFFEDAAIEGVGRAAQALSDDISRDQRRSHALSDAQDIDPQRLDPQDLQDPEREHGQDTIDPHPPADPKPKLNRPRHDLDEGLDIDF